MVAVPVAWRCRVQSTAVAGQARLGLALAFALLATASLVAQVTLDRVVAVVSGALVTLSDVRAARELRLVDLPADATDDDIVKLLIDRELMRGEVARFGTPEPPATEVDARLSKVTSALGDANAVAQALARCGLTPARLRAWVVEDMRIARHLDDRFAAAATLSDEDVLRFYRERGARFAVGGAVPPFEEVADEVRRQAVLERREGLVAQWLAGLRRSAVVRTPRR